MNHMYIHESEMHKYISGHRVKKGSLIFELNVLLLDTELPVWRTIAVPSNYTLEQLGRVAACAIGWIPRYFNFFGPDGEFIRGYDPYAYMIKEKEEDDDEKQEGEPSKKRVKARVARDIIISSILLDDKGNKRTVSLDFGSDGWLHEITLVKSREPDKKFYPKCIDGKNACPPEDCGGPDGYKSLLAALSDRNHEDHEEIKEWLNNSGYKKFNPKKFSVSSVIIG